MLELTEQEKKLRDDLRALSNEDIAVILQKNRDYGESWKRRGGVGAFMMLARKWDRVENIATGYGYDIFEIGFHNYGDVLDDIGDLRRYLFLVEAHVRNARGEPLVDDTVGLSGQCGFPDAKIFSNEQEQQTMRRYYETADCPSCEKFRSKFLDLDTVTFRHHGRCFDCTQLSAEEVQALTALATALSRSKEEQADHAASIRSQD